MILAGTIIKQEQISWFTRATVSSAAMITLKIPPAKLSLVLPPDEVCAKCEDALPRLCESYSASSYWDSDREDLKGWSIPTTSFEGSSYDKKPVWSWSPSELETSSHNCRACCFLQNVLKTDVQLSGKTLQPEDKVVLLPQYIGSLHHNKNQYDRCYRLKLQVFYKQPNESRLHGGPYSMLFPLARSTNDWEEMGESQVFHCRLVEENANMPLIKHWVHLCTTKHITTKSDSHSCQPEMNSIVKIIPFRLVDIKERCVVDGSKGGTYAALSYVWGPARRLLFTEENRCRLTTAGGLSDDHNDIPQTFQDAMNVAASLNIPYIWIDALCIRQDNNQDLTSHMTCMDKIYASAAVTIVSNTDSVDTGIPGISYPRKPSQVVYNTAEMSLINARPTFASSLRDSAWEARAWTLQEKIFSKRLLIFTQHQVFYHCSSATWFEDTILETPKNGLVKSISIAEHASPYMKSRAPEKALVYEAHVPLFPRNFFNLVEVFTQRSLSFEKDALYAINGVLQSVQSKYGEAIWGLPPSLFGSGLTWKYSEHLMSRRRENFPSWSWAGWRGCREVQLRFINTKADPLDPEYYFHQQDADGKFGIAHIPNDGGHVWRLARRDLSDPYSAYCLPDHPGGSAYVAHVMKSFTPRNDISPAPAQILSFWTSTSFLAIDSKLTEGRRYDKSLYKINDPHSHRHIGEIDLDPSWRFQHPDDYIGEFIVISVGFFPPSDRIDRERRPALLSVMLVERAEMAEDIASRVQLCSCYIPLDSWRSTGPKWRLVNLA